MSAPITLPDVESVLTGWLPGQLGDVRTLTDLPQDLAGAVPLLQVRRISGAVTHHALDEAFVDVNAFAVDDAGASALAIQAESVLLAARGVTTGGAVIRGAVSVIRPRWLPYADISVRLYAATYTIRLHPVPA